MKPILIACETSGVVREAFRSLGAQAVSCDLLPAEDGSPHHVQIDVRYILHPDRWKARSRTYPGIAAAMAEQWIPIIRG